MQGVDVAKLQGVVMYIDPAGGGKNGDETGLRRHRLPQRQHIPVAAPSSPSGYLSSAPSTNVLRGRYGHGQKELRIIETLEPVIERGSLIINEAVIDEDRSTAAAHEPAKRSLFSLFHQLSKMTRDRGALFHDDRADALEGAVRYWVKLLAINQDHAVARQREREFRESIADPLQHRRYEAPSGRGGSLFNKYLRR
jgi:hypothetical protein